MTLHGAFFPIINHVRRLMDNQVALKHPEVPSAQSTED